MADLRRIITEEERAEEQAASKGRDAQKIAALHRLRENTDLHSTLVTELFHSRLAILQAKDLSGSNPLYDRAMVLINEGNVSGFIDFLLELFESTDRAHQTHRPLFARTLVEFIRVLPKAEKQV